MIEFANIEYYPMIYLGITTITLGDATVVPFPD